MLKMLAQPILDRVGAAQLAWISICVLALGLSGCWGINVKAPPKDIGSAGKATAANTDISFIEVGKTTREDVEQRLGWANAALGSDRIFLARWLHSDRGTVWVTGYFPMGGDRRWEPHDVLVEFDASGVVTKFGSIADVELLSEMARAAARAELPGIPSSAALQVHATRLSPHAPGLDPGQTFEECSLVLSDASIELHKELKKKTDILFAASPSEIAGITGSKGHFIRLVDDAPSPDAAKILVELRFSRSFPVGKSVTIQLSGADTLALARVLSHAGFPK
jgi:hypothetical protein